MTGRFKSSFPNRHMAKQNAKVMESIRQPEPTPATHQPPTRVDLHTVQPTTHHGRDRQSTPLRPPMHAFSSLLSKGLAHDKPDNAHHQTPTPTPIPSYGGSRFKSSFAHRHKDQPNVKVMEIIRQAEARYQPPIQADLHTSRPITHRHQGKQTNPSPSQPSKHTPLSSNSPAPDNLLNARHQTPKPAPIPNYGSRERGKMNHNPVEGHGYTQPQTRGDSDKDLRVHASYARRKRELWAVIPNVEEQRAFDHMVQVALSNSPEASCDTVEANNPKIVGRDQQIRDLPNQHNKQELPNHVRNKQGLDAKTQNRKLDEEQDETGYEAETDSPPSMYYSTTSTLDSDKEDNAISHSGYASSIADNNDGTPSSSSYHYPVRKHEPPLPLKPQQVKITQNPNTGKHTPSSNRKEQLDVDFPNHRQIDIPELKQCVDSSEFIISLASPPQPGQKYGIIIVTSSEGEEVLGATGDEDAKKGSRDEQWEMVHPVKLGLDCSGYITYGDEIGDGRGEDVLDMGARKAAYDAFEASRRLWLNFVRRPW
jgi:hypothetical protein